MSCHKTCCKRSIKINEREINRATQASVSGLVLSEPGVYEICENVEWSVYRPSSTAITINASNVTLLFKDHTLRQVQHETANTVAVRVAQGVSNVVISGGSITEIAGQAVYIEPGVDCVTISEMKISKVGYNGTVHIVIIPVVFERESGGAIFANSSPTDALITHVTIEKCSIRDIGILDGVFTDGLDFGAIVTNFAKGVTVVDTDVQGIFGVEFATAYIPINTSDSYMARCTIRDIVSNREAVGIAATIAKNGVIEDVVCQGMTCKMKDNVEVARGAEGAKLSQCEDFKVTRCTFQDIAVVSEEEVHLSLGNTCVAQGLGLGNLASACKNVIVTDCVTQNVKNDGGLLAENANFVRTGGYTIQGFTNQCRFERCRVDNVYSNIGRVMGFGSKRYSINQNNSFVDCVANDIRAETTVQGDYAAGFQLNSANEIVSGCTASRVTNLAGGDAYGIVLDMDILDEQLITRAVTCLIQNNKVEYNGSCGLIDLTDLKANPISGTYAAFNGAGGAGPNYVGLDPVTYNYASNMQNWVYPSPPSAMPSAGANLVNLDLHF